MSPSILAGKEEMETLFTRKVWNLAKDEEKARVLFQRFVQEAVVDKRGKTTTVKVSFEEEEHADLLIKVAQKLGVAGLKREPTTHWQGYVVILGKTETLVKRLNKILDNIDKSD